MPVRARRAKMSSAGGERFVLDSSIDASESHHLVVKRVRRRPYGRIVRAATDEATCRHAVELKRARRWLAEEKGPSDALCFYCHREARDGTVGLPTFVSLYDDRKQEEEVETARLEWDKDDNYGLAPLAFLQVASSVGDFQYYNPTTEKYEPTVRPMIDLVPPAELRPYITQIRDSAQDRDVVDDIARTFRRFGVTNLGGEPLILRFSQDHRKMWLDEGHHRLLAAARVDAPWVPVKVLEGFDPEGALTHRPALKRNFEGDEGFPPGVYARDGTVDDGKFDLLIKRTQHEYGGGLQKWGPWLYGFTTPPDLLRRIRDFKDTRLTKKRKRVGFEDLRI